MPLSSGLQKVDVVFTGLVFVLHGIKVVVVQLSVAKHVLRLAFAALRLLIFCNHIRSTSPLPRVLRVPGGPAGALTFIVVADVLVPHLQVDVVLPALPFAALQPALRAQTRRHLLHVEAEKKKKKVTGKRGAERQRANDGHRRGVMMVFSEARSPVHERQRAQHVELVVCSRRGDVGRVGEHYSQHGPRCGNLCVGGGEMEEFY